MRAKLAVAMLALGLAGAGASAAEPPAIAIAMSRFQEFREMRVETDNLRQALEDRKIIERAKGILMKRASLDEPEAFRRLQKLARDKNQKLIEIAKIILTAEEACQAIK